PVLSFQERSLASNLVPDRDLGLHFLADLAGGRLQAAAGLFNGVPDASSADLETDKDKDAAFRLYVQPFKALGLGGALSYGQPHGSPTATGLTSGYKTEGQRVFFNYRSTIVNRDRRFRSTAQAYASQGPLGLEIEYVRSSRDVQTGVVSVRNVLNREAWQAVLSYARTGEEASLKGLKPRKIFDPGAGSWGALELVF